MGRKWSTTSKVSLALAAVMGLSAFLLVHGYTERVRALAPALGRPVGVQVAAHDLARGAALRPDMLRRVSMPSRFAPPGAVRDSDRVRGRVLLSPLAEGEPLTATRLSPARAGPIAALVPPGFRAVTVPVQLPARAVHPGDRVDLLATFTTGQRHVETLAESLEVLLVLDSSDPTDGVADTSGSGFRTLVVLAASDVAERLAYARAFAAISVLIDGPASATSGA